MLDLAKILKFIEEELRVDHENFMRVQISANLSNLRKKSRRILHLNIWKLFKKQKIFVNSNMKIKRLPSNN